MISVDFLSLPQVEKFTVISGGILCSDNAEGDGKLMRQWGLLQSVPSRITQYTRTEYELNIMGTRYMGSFRFVRNYS